MTLVKDIQKVAQAAEPKDILAIDPGNTQSGWVLGTPDKTVLGGLIMDEYGITPNIELRQQIHAGEFDCKNTRLVIETPKPRGMPTAGEEMETLIAIGRFIQLWMIAGGRWSFVFRQDVKLHLTGSSKAKDGNISQAIKDRFGGEQKSIKCLQCKGRGKLGLGKNRQNCATCQGSGLFKGAGPLHGVTSHVYAALGVALWWADKKVVQQVIINPGGRDNRKQKVKGSGHATKTSRSLGRG
jgi:hypothetical protein